jgi:hypothetical protein
MKTTLDIDDRLLIEAKARAARERTSLTKLIERGLSLVLRAAPGQPGKKIDLPVSKEPDGLRPGIDPCSNKALFRAAEGNDDS